MRTWKELDARQVLCPSPSTPTLTSHLRTAGREGGPEALGPEEGGGLAHQSPQARVGSGADAPPVLSPPVGEGDAVLSLRHTPCVHPDIRPALSLSRQAGVPCPLPSLLFQLQLGALQLPGHSSVSTAAGAGGLGKGSSAEQESGHMRPFPSPPPFHATAAKTLRVTGFSQLSRGSPVRPRRMKNLLHPDRPDTEVPRRLTGSEAPPCPLPPPPWKRRP